MSTVEQVKGHIGASASAADALPFLGLAIQFGLQPTLNKTFIGSGVSNTVLIIATEALKIGLSLLAIWLVTSSAERRSILESLSWKTSLRRAGIPAFLYAIQNWLILLGSKHISALSMSILNQTKTLSAAFFAWILLGKKQSLPQLVALVGLFVGAGLIVSAETNDGGAGKSFLDASTSWIGFSAVAGASLISGVSSATSEMALAQPVRGNVPKFATSLLFSVELASLGIVTLLSSALFGVNPDRGIFTSPFRNWTVLTLLPVLSNASGGILVGIVTQRAGGVKKGVSLILGICFATIVEALLGKRALTLVHVLAVALVATSMWVYFTFPYVQTPKSDQKKTQ